MKLYRKNIIFVCLLIFYHNTFSQSIGNGKDGSPNISGIINQYTSLTKNAYRCNYKINVKDNTLFNNGDLILVIQMQGAEIDNTNTSAYGSIINYNSAGKYEYAIVDSVFDNDVLQLKFPLLNTYSVDGKTQIVRVPQYKNPTITDLLTCAEWNGETGGILALDVIGTLTLKSNISANGKGFRGGKVIKGHHFFAYSHDYVAESYNPDWFSLKGEGIAEYGIFPYTSGRGSPANGGGGGNIHTSGGGGGANYGEGGNGGWGYPVDTLGNEIDVQGLGGKILNYDFSENRIFMGGGGGAGHEHFGNGTDGAIGGGIVIISADTIIGNSNAIWANGNGSAASGGYGDGTGGAGAGGTVLLNVNQFDDSLAIYVNGGNGGSSILKGFGPGGGGGGGVCLLAKSIKPDNLSVQVLGGVGGLAGGNYYGADSGNNGNVLYNTKIPFNNYYAGVRAAFNFSPDILTNYNTTIAFTNNSTGASNYYWSFGDEKTAVEENTSHTYSLGNYSITLIASDSLCSDTVVSTINYKIISNTISPNGDGFNDEFIFPVSDNESADVQIFSRWGSSLYKTSGTSIKWNAMYNGKLVENGVYYYTVFINNNITYKGFIEVVH